MSEPTPDFSSLKLVDTHAHISFPQFDSDRDRVIRQIEDEEVSLLVEIGTNVDDSERAFRTVEGLRNAFFSAGVHPHDSSGLDKEGLIKLETLLLNDKGVAVGEIGLDFFRNLSPVEDQVRAFKEQLELAARLDLPVVVHVREAYSEAYEILKEFGHFKGVIHAFSADLEHARKFVQMGFFLGIGGPLTYKKNEGLREVVRQISLDRLVCETDCPYLPPVPFRGKRNEPYYVGYVIKEIANQKGISPISCSENLLNNALRLFSISL